MEFGWLLSLGRFRMVGLLMSLVSLAGMGIRFGMVMDRQGARALHHCASQVGFNGPAAAKAVRCLGTAAVAIWTRRAGQLVPVGTVGR